MREFHVLQDMTESVPSFSLRLIGYSNNLAGRSDFNRFWNYAAAEFGSDQFYFALQGEETMESAIAFDSEQAVEMLEACGHVSVFRQGDVAVSVDAQSYKNPQKVYPHSVFEIEVKVAPETPLSSGAEWLRRAMQLTEILDLELAVVLGPGENTSDYIATPLGVGLGLIRPFWVMSFGKGYSALIQPAESGSAYFHREKIGSRPLHGFVTTRGYPEHVLQPKDRIAAKKREIGLDLFHRRPAEVREEEEPVSWIFSPRNVWRFARAVIRHKTMDWRQWQAKVVLPYYRA